MKHLVGLLATACATTVVKAEPLPNEQWRSYLAAYDVGPGSVLSKFLFPNEATLKRYGVRLQ